MKVRGFTDYNVDLILKFGGSILKDIKNCKNLIQNIVYLQSLGFRIVIIPGGGPTDKTIEEINKKQQLELNTCHRACALAQDQTGLIISDLSFSSRLLPSDNLETAVDILDQGKTAVILPSKILFDLNPVDKTWDITSDAIAAWFAWLMAAKRFAILTDVDGIYADYNVGSSEHLIPEISAQELSLIGHTSVDACAANFISVNKIDCMVLNGLFPGRLVDWMNGVKVVGTLIQGISQ